MAVPVKGVYMDKVRQNGGPVNYQTMGATLATVQNLLVSHLEQTNNPNSRVQHILIPSATMVDCPSTFGNSNKVTRKNMSKQFNLASAGNLTKDKYIQNELKLRVITSIRDKLTDPSRKIFQWGTLIMEMYKLPGEMLCGCRTWYFHPAHETASPSHRTSLYQHIKQVVNKIKALVKLNFRTKKTGFAYKRKKKD